jgi:hypothetical protein
MLSRSYLDMSFSDVVGSNYINPVSTPTNIWGLPTTSRSQDSFSYNEPKYNLVGPAVVGAAPFCFNAKLGDIGRSTILEQDKDIYLNEQCYLNINSSNVDTYAYLATAATMVYSAPLAVGACVISNIMLNIEVEDNLVLSNTIMKYWNDGGIKIRVDYVDTITTPLVSSTSNTIVSIPQMASTKLKRIINTVFNGLETGATAQDQNNMNGQKVKTITTVLDSQNLQNNIIDCEFATALKVGNMDYSENESFIQGTAIQNIPVYQYNWAFIDDFSGDMTLGKNDQFMNHDAGLQLNTTKTYQVKMSTPTASPGTPLVLYTFIITSRVLHFGPSGIQWVL